MKKIPRVSPQSIQFPKDYSLLKQGISQTMMSNFLKCRKAFLYSLNRYTHPSKIEKVNFGAMFHDVVADVYRLKRIPTEKEIDYFIEQYKINNEQAISFVNLDKMERDCAACYAIMTQYVERYKNDILNCKFDIIEHEFGVEHEGIIWRGKIDARYLTKNNSRWQMEHKTKGRISEDSLQKRLTFDPQNLTYLLAGEIEFKEKVDGVLYNIVRNPQLKMKIGESIKDFKDRIIEDAQSRPDFYFMQFEIPYTSLDKKRFLEDLKLIVKDIKDCIANHNVYKNGFSCDAGNMECEFLQACSSNSFEGYIILDKLFPELSECKY